MGHGIFRIALRTLVAAALAAGAVPAGAQTPTTLANFNGADGGGPLGTSLTIAGSTLYGMASGGPNGDGVVFSLPTTGGTPTNLLSFTGGGPSGNGASPVGNLVLSADGSTLYGTTYQGGNSSLGNLFSMPVSGGTSTTLASFGTGDGSYPEYLTPSADGSTLYGTTDKGGADGKGVVFSVPVTGGTPTVLASFNGTDGNMLEGPLLLVGSTLYGTTNKGGANNDGTIFSIPVTGGTPTVLASLNETDGQIPNGLTLVGTTLYGTAQNGGADTDGTTFSLPLAGGTPTVLASFDNANGLDPVGPLILVGSSLYGVTSFGGADGDGSIFSIPLAGGGLTTLASFNSTYGEIPYGPLTLGGSTLYGMTWDGGGYGDGTVFAFLTPEPSSWALLATGAAALLACGLRRQRKIGSKSMRLHMWNEPAAIVSR